MKFFDHRIRITGCVVMALLSYFVAAVNVGDRDLQSALVLAIIGIYFTHVSVRQSRRYMAGESRRGSE